jgi:hypothetical protein
MQKNPGELSDDDQRTYRRWTIGFSLLYGAVFVTFASLVMMHPPITDDVIAKVESPHITGPVVIASKKADRR